MTDSSAGTASFTYRLSLIARELASFNFQSPDDGPAGEPVQSLSIISTEE